jgi:hypothetical protein
MLTGRRPAFAGDESDQKPYMREIKDQFGEGHALRMQGKLAESATLLLRVLAYKNDLFVACTISDTDFEALDEMPVVDELNGIAVELVGKAKSLQEHGDVKAAVQASNLAVSIFQKVPGIEQLNIDNFWRTSAVASFRGIQDHGRIIGSPDLRRSEIRHASYDQRQHMKTQAPNPKLAEATALLNSLQSALPK